MSSVKLSGDALVSVVIICFNQSQFLGNAIESALAQTTRAIETIVVNDGSTDRTEEVARCYPRASYVYQQNGGISSARNAGVRASSGRYVAFLDADDRLLPTAAEAGLCCFRKFPESGFVFGRYHKVDVNGNIISAPNHPPEETDFYTALLQRNLIGMQSTVLYAREALERSRGFDERLRRCEDYELYLRIAREFPVHKHDEVVAEYRRHGQNMSQNYRPMLETTLQVLNSQAKYVPWSQRHRQALRAGIANWRNHYGNLMVQDFHNNFKTHGLGRSSIRSLSILARTYPKGIGLITKDGLRSVIHRSLRMGS